MWFARILIFPFSLEEKRGKATERRSTVGQSLKKGVKLEEQRCIQRLVTCQEQCRAQYTWEENKAKFI